MITRRETLFMPQEETNYPAASSGISKTSIRKISQKDRGNEIQLYKLKRAVFILEELKKKKIELEKRLDKAKKFSKNFEERRLIKSKILESLFDQIEPLLELLKRDIDFLKTTHSRIEESDNTKETLFNELQKSIENLSVNFKDKGLRLNNFMDLKNVLASLNKEARKWNNVYLLRTIIIFYDSIKHAYAEKLIKKQCDVIKQVGNIITSEILDREKFKEVYKKLLTGGFQIIPKPRTNE